MRNAGQDPHSNHKIKLLIFNLKSTQKIIVVGFKWFPSKKAFVMFTTATSDQSLI